MILNRKNVFVPALILIGTVLIIISIWSPQSSFRRGSREAALANVIEKSGSVTLQNNEMPAPIELEARQSLNARDVVRTGEGGDVSIQWGNEGQFRVLEKSEVLIDQLDDNQPIVIVRSGDLYIEKFGRKPSFWVRKDGQSLSALDFALADKAKLNRLKEALPEKENQNQLAQAEIENLLNSKKTDFFKCYGQVLQKNAQASGSVLIAFTILNQGQTAKIEISKSEINDSAFKACLIEVVARTQFKSFSGAPVTTVFPMRFE